MKYGFVLVVVMLVGACTTASPVTTTSSIPSTTSVPGPPEAGWVARAPMSVLRSEHPAVALDGEIVVIGGLVEFAVGRTGTTESVEAYDPASDSWRALPDFPALRHHAMAAVVDGRLFVIGGYGASGFMATRAVWELVGERWEERSALPYAIGAGAAAVIDGQIYVVGGTPTSGLVRYDPASDEWSILSQPTQAREHVGAASFNGELWAIGGRWDQGAFATVEIYDPDTETWRAGPTMKDARSGFGVAVLDGVIYVAGGEILESLTVVATAERYDPATGVWEYIEDPPLALHGNPLVALEGSLYLPGGSVRAAAADNDPTLFVFTPG